MGKSVIQTKGIPFLGMRNNGVVASGGRIAQLLVPEDGLYLINYCGQAYPGWFNGVTDTSSPDYHASLSFSFLRLCEAGETVYVINGAGQSHNFAANFQIAKVR